MAGRDDWPDRVIVTDSQRVDHPRKWRKTAVMTDRWRLLDGNRLYDIKADPAQENGDVSPKYPMVKEKLRQEYDKWWDDVSERFGEYCCTIVGSDAEKLTKLTSHDWHADGPWNQGQIRKGEINNGFWAIDVARDGEYEFAFRRWPREVRIPLGSALSGAKRIRARLARIRITAEVPTEYDYSAFGAEYKTAKGEYYDDILVNSTQQDAKFRLKLKAGKAFLQTWLEDREGKTVGAYYVYVRRLV